MAQRSSRKSWWMYKTGKIKLLQIIWHHNIAWSTQGIYFQTGEILQDRVTFLSTSRGCQECPNKRPLMYSYLGVVSSDGRYMESASDSGIEARDELTDLWVSRDSASRWDTLESVPMMVERERDLAHWSKRSLSWSSERVSGVSICWQKINQPMVR